MSSFVPTNYDLRTALLFCFHLKKTAAESHRMLLQAFGEHALGKTQCFEWFKWFKSGDFDVRNEERGRPPKKFEDTDLQALLDEDDAQTQQQLADKLKPWGRYKRWGNGFHINSTKDSRKPQNIMRNAARQVQKKVILHRIVTGDEKWIYFENPKRNKSWVTPGEPSTSTPRPNRYGRKTMLCVWWDQKGVIYYELLKPGENVLLLHGNVPAHKAKQILQHAAYSPDLAPSDYYLFASMGQALVEQRFPSYEDVRKWLDDWFASKEQQLFWRGIHILPERWEKCIYSDGQYFE
ncbi:Transposase [Caligus rogercresseyi]|uniref:Transposase n=1 Tax=Caligus rogercresseyi TaxID=217165 RepID=A0A7T8K763_CALRO|nr:Transposase [Caligus rogercresseyi]